MNFQEQKKTSSQDATSFSKGEEFSKTKCDEQTTNVNNPYDPLLLTEEFRRMKNNHEGQSNWRLWGPYLSEREWGRVNEDYSPYGNAWEYFSHDQARSRAYRWGEDGIAGISDNTQKLCFALALWNGKDPILKERLFGLTGNEGNHGEDVKEYYFYLENLPSHAYMKYLYKYPQEAFPYNNLVETNKKRSRHEFEYELLDTGIFDQDRYFDVFVEYAKANDKKMFISISIANRGPEEAILHVLPTLWFRNNWSWGESNQKPSITMDKKEADIQVVKAVNPSIGNYWLYCKAPDSILFTENETNNEKLFQSPNSSPYVKDAFHEYLIHSRPEVINSQHIGTKMAAYYLLKIPQGETRVIKLCLSNQGDEQNLFGETFDTLFKQRKEETDIFYDCVTPFPLSEDMKNIQRQAYAGLLWNKQYYHYSVEKWLNGDPNDPRPPEERKNGRNKLWPHLFASDIFSMPDKWEYPWFAAWDLAFHTLTLARIDIDFAKQQLLLITEAWYMSPDGQIPAYEWNFSDANPPVHAWAALRIYNVEYEMFGRKDRIFLEKLFQKLNLNFTWWVNRKDINGGNVFGGGFLGLDNISSFNRTGNLPLNGTLEQSDGTGWVASFCLDLYQIAVELAVENPVYEDIVVKYFEHFFYIADALNNLDQGASLWDEKKGFYYSILNTSNGEKFRLCENSLVDIIPLFATGINFIDQIAKFPNFKERFEWFLKNLPEKLEKFIVFNKTDKAESVLLSLVEPEKIPIILKKILDEDQFLSLYGIRSISKKYSNTPFAIDLEGEFFQLDYEPAESTTALFGGNSNWRGPIWFPINYLFIQTLQKYHFFYGDKFKIEYPTGSGNWVDLWTISEDITSRMISIFLKDHTKQHRPVYGGTDKFQNDPHWRDYILFYEYFHGDNGAGVGASHQTGWTGLVASLIHQYAEFNFNQSPKVIESRKINT